MSDIADLVMIAEDRHAERQERRDTAIEAAHDYLVTCYMVAATSNPLTEIPTPAWYSNVPAPLGSARTPMVDVLADSLAGVGSENLWREMVTHVAATRAGLEWLIERAHSYATFHEVEEAEE